MLDERRIDEAESNVQHYLREGLLRRYDDEVAEKMYIKNAENSLETAVKLVALETSLYSPHLWVIVTSYYSMYYSANAVLLHLGYKVGDRISHKVTSDAVIVFVRAKLKRSLLDGYEGARADAIDLLASQADSIVQSLDFERQKRSRFQYEMDESVKRSKASTSLQRAKEFLFEMKRLL